MCRVSLRSGTGLFVTDNLLYPGYCMIHLVSLKSSLSAVCMKEGDMVQMKLPEELSSGATRLILATPDADPVNPDRFAFTSRDASSYH